MLPTAASLFEKLPRSLRRHRLMKAWMRLTGEDPLQLVRIRDQAFGYADMRNGFLRLIVIEDDFEKDFFRIGDALLQDGGVFFDVGANHGLFSLGLAARHGATIDIHLFEPNPVLVESIRKSLALYPGIRVHVNTAAVSNRNGTVLFFVDHEQSGTSHVVASGGITVPALTIDDYLARETIGRVAFMKMDIEGHELAALRGARRGLETRRLQAIYFEYSETLLRREHVPAELLDDLDAAGYQVCFCRAADVREAGGPMHTLRAGLPGYGLALIPIAGLRVPQATDLLAVPKENLVAH